MSDENTNITELQVQKLNLQPGDVLMVTVNHPDIDEDSARSLKDKLASLFPNNKVMLFTMGPEGYVKFTVATSSDISYNEKETKPTQGE